jgi:acyl-lipid omega-6 desaturase (Delta-12 desaturase)
MHKTTWNQIRLDLKKPYDAWPTLVILLVDGLLVIASWYLAQAATLLTWTLSQILMVIVLTHLYVIHHETVHSAVFKSRTYNEILGHILSVVIALPFLPRRHSHLHHHNWAGNINDHTNQRLIARLSSVSDSKLKIINFLWKLCFPLLVVNERIALWRKPFHQWFKGERTKANNKEIVYQVNYLAFYFLFFVLVGWFGFFTTFINWFLPAWIMLVFVEEMANLPHHADTELYDSPQALPFWEQDSITHSCRSIPLWSKWILLNFNLHTSHHFFPWLPWYKLPEAQKQIQKYAPQLGQENVNEFSWLIKRRSVSYTDVFQAYIRK